MEIKNKDKSIFSLFLKNLVWFSLSVIGLLLVTYVIITFSMQTGIVLPASYSDEKMAQLEGDFQKEFDSEKLPAYSKYVWMDQEGALLDTNMKDRDASKLKKYLSKGKKSMYDFYKIIQQDNGNTIIIHYDMLAHFSNPNWNRIIPYPEFLILVVILAFILLFSVLTAMKFSRTLQKNLVPIERAAEKIKKQNLDFEIEPTQIREFNTSLKAMEQLKIALSDSLKEQWTQQQRKKTQLAALCHDIKTPLTVIKGNAELLCEDEEKLSEMEMLSDILNSAGTIEKYVELLMNALNQEEIHIVKKQVPLQNIVQDLCAAIIPLCRTKNIHFKVKNDVAYKTILVDFALLKRAILNIVDNAVRFCSNGGNVELHVYKKDALLFFEIKDDGCGFSKEGLEKADEEFFTQDKSRSGKNYGLGLSFVKNVAGLHNGTICFANNTDGKGAAVAISIAESK